MAGKVADATRNRPSVCGASADSTQKVGASESAFGGRLKIAQRFIAGIGRGRDEVREADG
jgi:hypothetical protein